MMSISSNNHRRYTFGRFTFDIDRGALTAGGEDIKLRPKSFQVLQYLIERQGCLVSKNDILDAIWGQTVVTDDAVTQCLLDIRRALGDRSQKMIRTIPRRGYLFDKPVTLIPGTASAPGMPTRNNLVPSWFRWQVGVAILLVFGIAAVLWGLAGRLADAPAVSARAPMVESYSVAVLPFLDLSPDQDLGYFAEGISEEILNLLAQVNGLRVIARTSSFSFKGQATDIATIKEKLKVTHVLEGSVRQFEDTIRITAQLVNAANSEHVWSETYDRKLNNVFAIQDEIAVEVLKQLTTSLNISIPKTEETNVAAYHLYLQAVHMIDQLDFTKNDEAELVMRRALELDPNFAPAWRELSRILWRKIGDRPSIEEDIARTMEALKKAFEIEPDDAATLAYLGWHLADFDGELFSAARLVERALSYAPANENVVRIAALFAHAFGRPEDAVKLGEFGVSRNPVCFPCYIQLAAGYRNADRLDDAESTCRMMLSLFDRGYGELGMILLLKGQPMQALDAYSEDPSERRRLFGKALALHSLGRSEESEIALTQYLELMANAPTWRIAQAYAWTGHFDAAFEAIDLAAKQRQVYVDGRIVRWSLQNISAAARHPVFRRLHSDPRWDEFLDKYGISANEIAEVKFSVKLPD